MFCQGELPVLLQLETTSLLIFTAKVLQLVLHLQPHVGRVFWARRGELGDASGWEPCTNARTSHVEVTLPLLLQIKPVVSQYLKQKKLPYNEDTYASRLRLFLQRYEELMVHAPPITELVGIQ